MNVKRMLFQLVLVFLAVAMAMAADKAQPGMNGAPCDENDACQDTLQCVSVIKSESNCQTIYMNFHKFIYRRRENVGNPNDSVKLFL